MLNRNRVTIENQKKAFKSQLEIAAEIQAPIVIHCRDLEEEAYEMMIQVTKIFPFNFGN